MKIDVTVTKGITVNMGNYENVRPEITLNAKDIDPDKVNRVYELLTEIADDMFSLEIAKQIDMLDSVRKTRPTRFAEIILEERKDDINSEIQDLLKDLSNL